MNGLPNLKYKFLLYSNILTHIYLFTLKHVTRFLVCCVNSLCSINSIYYTFFHLYFFTFFIYLFIHNVQIKLTSFKASESVTKLFRPSSAAKSAATTPATNSGGTPTSSATMDSVSLVSNASPPKSTDTEIIEIIDESSPDTSKTFPTPSTAIMGEIRSLDSVDSTISTKDLKQKLLGKEQTEQTPKRIVSKYEKVTSIE